MYVYNMTKAELSSFIKGEVRNSLHQVLKAEQEKVKALVPKNSNDFFTIKEVAQKFRVTNATIHNWVKKGHLKKMRISGRTLFNKHDVENMSTKEYD